MHLNSGFREGPSVIPLSIPKIFGKLFRGMLDAGPAEVQTNSHDVFVTS